MCSSETKPHPTRPILIFATADASGVTLDDDPGYSSQICRGVDLEYRALEYRACSRRNSDAIAGLWAHGNAALGAGLRLRRSGRIYGTRRSCRAGAYHRAGDRRRRELFRHRGAVRRWRIGKEPWPRLAKAEAG